jgi:hypothetical protein
VAAASTVAAAWVALQPQHLRDFEDVRRWLLFWNFGANDPYAVQALAIDYPPNALLVLWPLAWLSEPAARLAIVGANVVLLAGGIWLLIDWLGGMLTASVARAQVASLTAVVLATDMARSSIWMGQTMPLALALAAVALKTRESRPALAALALGLLAFKPHVALALGLGMFLAGGAAVPLGGALVAMALVVASAIGMGQGTLFVLREYAQGLARQYAAAAHFRSETNVREVLEAFAGFGVARDAQLILAAAGLAWLVVAARRAPRDRETTAVIVAATLLWGLVSLPFQRFGVLLAVPALGLLTWTPGFNRDSRTRIWFAAGLVAMHVADLPLLVHAAAFALTPDPFRNSWTLFLHRLGEFHSFDILRLTVAALFVLTMRDLSHRRANTNAQGRASIVPVVE